MNVRTMARAATLACLALAGTQAAAGPTGAKAIFDSGQGGSIAMSAARPAAAPVAAREAASGYVGISYQILALAEDGQILPVTRNRVFRSGERLKILARTNRPGYLTVMNVGPTGNTHVLFSEFVEPFRMVEVPRNSNLRMVGAPGTERLLFMLSNEPNPMAPQPAPTTTASATAAAPAAGQPYPPTAPPAAADGSTLPPAAPAYGSAPPAPAYGSAPPAPAYGSAPPAPAYGSAAEPPPAYPPPMASTGDPASANAGLPPPPPVMLAQIDGAKALKGAKDLVVEDGMNSSYSVISPQDAWKPRQMGMKDVVLESEGGVQYGVVPVSAMARGGILTLEIKLRHQ